MPSMVTTSGMKLEAWSSAQVLLISGKKLKPWSYHHCFSICIRGKLESSTRCSGQALWCALQCIHWHLQHLIKSPSLIQILLNTHMCGTPMYIELLKIFFLHLQMRFLNLQLCLFSLLPFVLVLLFGCFGCVNVKSGCTNKQTLAKLFSRHFEEFPCKRDDANRWLFFNHVCS